MPSPIRALPAFVLACSCAAIRPAPVDTRTPLAKAQADLAAGHHDDAAKEFDEILEREPGSLAALRGRVPSLRRQQEGRWGYILAWLVGVPIPILVLIYLLRGCT